ncbi:hypothetical protein ACETK8_15810 [Brevundimonas staleyi]|uniref:Uncharacterized protein n=1 Tax=Brevundimonas staleyi TaxID=74326 RepID=A0ABW0FX19_9CAUL
MTDALPQDTPELEPARGFDSARLIADVRLGDQDAIREAYRRTFGTAMGRVVLLHALASIGEIGAPRGAESPEENNHKNGRGYAVLTMANLAGFDPVAVAAAGLTQTLEGADYERSYTHPDSRTRADAVAVTFSDADTFTGGAAEPDAGGWSDPGP